MRILVTGASGFLGRSLMALDEGIEWVGCGRSPAEVGPGEYFVLDVTDAAAVAAAVARVRPDWVINTAAATDVDRCEVEVAQAHRLNVGAVEALATVAARLGAGVVQLSTDYVFDGTSGPYAEADAPHPLSVYGRTKLASERVLAERLERSIVVRTLWLYGYEAGARPNFVTRALTGLRQGEPVRAFDDQWGNPTYVDDLARALVALCRAEATGVFHMGGASFMTRYEMVGELARRFELDAGAIVPIRTQSAGLPAPRPLRSGLRTEALCGRTGIVPRSFAQGLDHMRGQPAFQRAFGDLR
jgi:dTDP-4-dehydrorhamnose reductase